MCNQIKIMTPHYKLIFLKYRIYRPFYYDGETIDM